MACKQGIRASMEASRAFYHRQKEYDPYRELWVSLVNRSSQDQHHKRMASGDEIHRLNGPSGLRRDGIKPLNPCCLISENVKLV